MIQRKPRPLTRDESTFRDDRLFIVACDDRYAPKQYFDAFRISRVKIHVVPTEDGTSSAEHVLRRLLEITFEEGDERWLLLDTDHHVQGTHLASFTAALSEAKRQGVQVALSRPCFELWLLLHHSEEGDVSALADAQAVAKALQKKLGGYDKTNLKAAHFPQSLVATACERARRLDAAVTGGEIPDSKYPYAGNRLEA